MKSYRFDSISSLFLENAEAEELDEVKFDFDKTLCTAVSSHSISMTVAYLNVLVLEVFAHKPPFSDRLPF